MLAMADVFVITSNFASLTTATSVLGTVSTAKVKLN